LDCSNESEVRAFLAPKIQIIVEEILKGIEEWNKKEINRVVYSFSPAEYERTYEFRDAWTGEITESGGDGTTGEFKYDPEKIVSIWPGTHASVALGDYGLMKDVRDSLADIIYNGLAGDIFGHGFWTAERDAWKELIRIVGGPKMRTWIRAGARKAGLHITFD